MSGRVTIGKATVDDAHSITAHGFYERLRYGVVRGAVAATR
jgi:hypothetical protein